MVILAIKALKDDPKLKIGTTVKIYDVDRITLMRRRDGKPIRYDTLTNSRKLIDLEE